MPNRCSNTLTIIADEKRLKEVEKKITNDKWYLSFEVLIKIPKHIDYEYDFCVNRRGTKRDVVHDEIVPTKKEREIFVSFDTARSPPEQWFSELCKQFPDVWFELYYEEPGMDFEWDMISDWEWGYTDNERNYTHYCDMCCEKQEDAIYREDIDDDNNMLCNDCYQERNK